MSEMRPVRQAEDQPQHALSVVPASASECARAPERSVGAARSFLRGGIRAALALALGPALMLPAFAQEQVVVGVIRGGNYMAHGIVLMEEIAARTTIDFIYEPGNLGDQLTALTGGLVDVVVTPVNATDERRAMGITFSATPILMNAEAVYVRAADEAAFVALADLRGVRVGVLAGSTTYVNAVGAAGATAVTFANNIELHAALVSGDVAAVVAAAATFDWTRNERRWSDVRKVEGYVATMRSPGWIAVRTEDAALLDRINPVLAELFASGFLADVATRWYILPPE